MPGVVSIDAVALLPRFGCLPALITVFLLGACQSDQVQTSPLFAATATPLSVADQNAIHAIFATWYPLSADGLQFHDEACGNIPVQTESIDLNADGVPEVFVTYGNSCNSGATGSRITLFVKDKSGTWRDQLGFPAFGYDILPTSNAGYPDLQFGGPGFCFGVWSWDGSNYVFKCNAPQEEGGCQYTGNVCPTN